MFDMIEEEEEEFGKMQSDVNIIDFSYKMIIISDILG